MLRPIRPAISGSIFVKDASKCLQQPQPIFRMASVRKSAATPTGKQLFRVAAVGDTIIGEQGLVAIIRRHPRYRVCGAAHTFDEANKLVRRHRPYYSRFRCQALRSLVFQFRETFPEQKDETKHYDNYPLNNIKRPVTFAARFAFHPARSLLRAGRRRRSCTGGKTGNTGSNMHPLSRCHSHRSSP